MHYIKAAKTLYILALYCSTSTISIVTCFGGLGKMSFQSQRTPFSNNITEIRNDSFKGLYTDDLRISAVNGLCYNSRFRDQRSELHLQNNNIHTFQESKTNSFSVKSNPLMLLDSIFVYL